MSESVNVQLKQLLSDFKEKLATVLEEGVSVVSVRVGCEMACSLSNPLLITLIEKCCIFYYTQGFNILPERLSKG